MKSKTYLLGFLGLFPALACGTEDDMRFVYQGADPRGNPSGEYGFIPYRLALLTPDW